MPDLNDIDVIAPNFKRRLSGVTSTVVRLVPLQARSIAITACGPDLPGDVPNVCWPPLITMSRCGPSGARVWHARRNIEMIAGLALRHLLRKRLRLVFTSASQRHHTRLTKALIARMDAVIATSHKSAYYLDRPATVIPHGINTDAFTACTNKQALKSRLNVPPGRLIGCFGRIRPQKGTDVFVDAMIKTLPRHPDAAAIVMGHTAQRDMAYLDDLKERTRAAGLTERLLFLPEVSPRHMPNYYRALDLYIAPQRWEGFGLTPLEAMACDVPTIATRVGAFPEMILHGQTGLLIDPDDVPAMGAAANLLLADPATSDTFAKNALAHIAQKTEADAINAIYLRLLQG